MSDSSRQPEQRPHNFIRKTFRIFSANRSKKFLFPYQNVCVLVYDLHSLVEKPFRKVVSCRDMEPQGLNLPSSHEYGAFQLEANKFGFIASLDCQFTLNSKSNLFTKRQCMSDSAELHLAALMATSIIKCDFFVTQFVRCLRIAGTEITPGAVRRNIASGFRLYYIRFGKNFDKSGMVIQTESVLSRTMFIHPMLVPSVLKLPRRK